MAAADLLAPQGKVAGWGRVVRTADDAVQIDVDAGALANELIRLRDDPQRLAEARERSLEWAESHSWERLVDLYWTELARVIANPLPPPVVDQRQHNPFSASR